MSQISNDARFFVRSGSVLYAIKCIQTEAVLRTEKFCFDKVPVTFIKNNRSVNSYLDPLTYVLTPTAIRIPCSDILLQKFNLLNVWWARLSSTCLLKAKTSWTSTLPGISLCLQWPKCCANRPEREKAGQEEIKLLLEAYQVPFLKSSAFVMAWVICFSKLIWQKKMYIC